MGTLRVINDSVLITQDFRCTMFSVTIFVWCKNKLSCVVIFTLSKPTQKLLIYFYIQEIEMYTLDGDIFRWLYKCPLLWHKLFLSAHIICVPILRHAIHGWL